MSSLIFPEGFIWGTSTASYQIEGSHNADGKGESIWDRFTHTPGNITNNDTGDVACDHYRLYENDIKLMKELGIKSYRFSISWTRIFPDGKGIPNQKGIDFYKKLIKLLVDNNIIPTVTLYHWDLPQKLQDIGGWTSQETVDSFVHYAKYVFKELGEMVPIWITFNEPWVSAFVGYWYGSHPPRITDLKTALLAAHNILLAHGLAVRAFREMRIKGEIGISLNLNPVYPASEDEKDISAALRYAEYNNGWFLDPILRGEYPINMVSWFSDKSVFPKFNIADMEIISTPIDFLGVNNYSSNSVMHDNDSQLLQVSFATTGKAVTDSGWEIYPEGLYDLLMYLHSEYKGIKLMITENGAAYKDIVNDKGQVDDDNRISYLNDHIIQAHKAVKDGVNLVGYYVWSFMDNFEWNLGYSKRFGLVYIDYIDQKRIIKKSGLWYKDVIQKNGLIVGQSALQQN